MGGFSAMCSRNREGSLPEQKGEVPKDDTSKEGKLDAKIGALGTTPLNGLIKGIEGRE